MREILFRGKRVDNVEWIQGFLVIWGDDYYIAPDINACTSMGGRGKGRCMLFGRYYQVLPETVGQFTGLIDKNGKKIFEGDICRIKEHGDVDLAVISFEHGAFYATPHNANIHEHTLWDIWYNDYDIEVIGNIYDNPELLEVVE